MSRLIEKIACSLVLFGLMACRDKPLFRQVDAVESGITFANTITGSDSLSVMNFEYLYNGGGVGTGDFNNDGRPDIFFSGNQVPGRLYLNRGNFRFTDITATAGVQTTAWCTGVSLVDINADGLLDLYLCTINPERGQSAANLLYINQGVGVNGIPTFREVAAAVGLADTGYSTQAAFFDYDRDGDLDCYLLTNALESFNRNQPVGPVTNGTGKSTDRLYRNMSVEDGARGLGQRAANANSLRPTSPARRPMPQPLRFEDVSRQEGITLDGWGLGVAIADFNDDGWPDVYCANDFQSNDLLWINQHDATGHTGFVNRVADYTSHQSYNAMGIDVADLNNDGLPELMTLDMMPDDNRRQKSMFTAPNIDRFQLGLDRGYHPQYVRNVLQMNLGKDARGQVHFAEVGQLAGVSATDWSWSTLMADFDNDGLRDMFVTNGYPKDITDLDYVAYNRAGDDGYFGSSDARTETEARQKIEQLIGVKKANRMFQNRTAAPGQPPQFTDVTTRWGFDMPSFSNGAAYADFDNDGDLDIVVNTINDPALLYENTTISTADRDNNAGHFLRLKLVGEGGNPSGIGATVELRYRQKGHWQTQVARQSPCRGYKSTVEPTLHFGLGKTVTIDTLRITWPDGRVSQQTGVRANQLLTVSQRGSWQPLGQSPSASGTGAWFSALRPNPIPFRHPENAFIDVKEQPLLPHGYAQYGPGMAVGDVDGNGLDDVFVGGGVKHGGTIFRQLPGGAPPRFVGSPLLKPGERKLGDDMGALFFDADNDGDLDLYVVAGGNEWPADHPNYQDHFYRNDGPGPGGAPRFTNVPQALPNTRASGSCVVAADYDRDGDLDLFVGGRVVPRRYPMSARSSLLRNDGGRFTDVTAQVAPELAQIGMVTSALWSDYDNDGQVDLVVAGEFMPVTFFTNRAGRLEKTASRLPSGWWNSLTAGDFDNDGDIDYVAGNLGLNSRFKASASEPVSVYARDFDQNGTLDPILCAYTNGKCYPAPPRDQLAGQVPGLKKRFTSYAAYGRMTIDELFTPDELRGAYVANATELRSSYIENRGNGSFAIRPLPPMAQTSPVFGMLSEDIDQDGNLDLLLVGNDYGTDVQVGRYDAGRGLWLRGTGRGSFVPVFLPQSGFCANRDARSLVSVATALPSQPLYLIANNSDTLQTFRPNRHPATPPGSVPLRPDDCAAALKLANGRSRRIEFYYGSGYLAQSSRRLLVPVGTTVTVTNYRGQRRVVNAR